MDRTWFEMPAIRRRVLRNSVWIPLRQSESRREGDYGIEGFNEEYYGCGSLLIPLSSLQAAEELAWTQIGFFRDHGPIVDGEHYVPTGIYQFGADGTSGEEPVLEQTFPDGNLPIWHLNLDITFALRLLREEDVWVRPDEIYAVVARLRRDGNGNPILLEMKSEFLKDYLRARNMALRVSRYFKRTAILEDVSHLEWTEGTHSEDPGNRRFARSVTKIHEGGDIFGAETAVIQLARTDVDQDDDVPLIGDANNDNIESSSWTTRSGGRPLYRVAGEFWSDEWVQPAEVSPRVRWDRVPSSCDFIVGASGESMNADDINSEDAGRWLWFRSEVIEAILECRGSHLQWYTRDTGGIQTGPGSLVHFGVNDLQRVTVYATDITKLPEWNKKLWLGYNISPEGGVSEELLAPQVRATPADTQAPERHFHTIMDRLDVVCQHRWGQPLFRDHSEVGLIVQKVHRFRAKGEAGLLALAKDITRLVADRLNVDLLHQLAPEAKRKKWGSLKSLEAVLSNVIEAEKARKLMGPLFGVYELRQGDAHLSGSKMQDAMNLLSVERDVHPIKQAFQIIHAVVVTLGNVGKVISQCETEVDLNGG